MVQLLGRLTALSGAVSKSVVQGRNFRLTTVLACLFLIAGSTVQIGRSEPAAESQSDSAHQDTRVDPHVLRIEVSPLAADKLQGESIKIIESIYGEPKDPNDPDVSEDGTIVLGGQEKELSEIRPVTFGGVWLNSSKLAKLTSDPIMDFNIFSARKKYNNNILDCHCDGEPFNPLNVPPQISCHCRLIGEGG